MNLNLSWDLFIIVFLAVVTAYSFIIGRNQTLKVITATYIGILCADGLGNIFDKYLASSETFLRMMRLFSVSSGDQATAFLKVLILIIFVVLIAVRGLFNYEVVDNRPVSLRLGLVMILGIMSGGLMLSAMLIFVSGGSLVMSGGAGTALAAVYEQSRLVKMMIDFSNLWFFLPGLVLVFLSVFSKK